MRALIGEYSKTPSILYF